MVRHWCAAAERAERARDEVLQQEQMCDLRIRVLGLELEKAEAAECAANAPMRAEVDAKAVAAWGPDHVARPPTAVYDLRGPLQHVPPPEQLPDGSWKGGRVPAVMPKQA